MYTQPVAELTVNILLSQLAEVNKYFSFYYQISEITS